VGRKQWTRERYRALLDDSVRNIPDLHYDIQLLVVGPDHYIDGIRRQTHAAPA
jgi:hypothetical protein